MSMKSMEIGYCCSYELESKGLFSTCSKFIMYLGNSMDVLRSKIERRLSLQPTEKKVKIEIDWK